MRWPCNNCEREFVVFRLSVISPGVKLEVIIGSLITDAVKKKMVEKFLRAS